MTTELNISHRAVEARKQTFVRDLKSVVSDADDLLKEVANSTAEEFAVARSRMEDKLNEARSRLHDARILATRKAYRAADATQEYVMDNPLKVAGVAVAAGLLAAFLLSRRSD